MTIKGPFAVVVLIVLVLSVTANLLIAGFTIARLGEFRSRDSVERLVTLGTRSFPQPLRDDIVSRVRAGREVLRGPLRDVEAARRQMLEAMRAEPFDRAALNAAYEQLRDATAELQRAGQDIVADAIADAPPDVRRSIRLRHRGPKRPPPPR